MLGYLSLAAAGLRRRPLQSLLSLLSGAAAFFLLGVMSGVLIAMDNLVASLSEERLRVVSRAGFGQTLPLAHAQRIAELDGVAVVAAALAFPGTFQQPGNTFGGAAVALPDYLDAMPDLVLDVEDRDALLRTRNGATVGAALAERYGWRKGDEVPLTSSYLVNRDGDQTWPVRIVAIHNKSATDARLPANELYLNLDYVDGYRVDDQGTAHMFVVSPANPAAGPSVGRAVDELFINSTHATRTFPEQAFFLHRLQQIGDIGGAVSAILAAVFFALVLVLASAMWQTALLRQVEFGILKAIGYSDMRIAGLIFVEVFVLLGVAVLLGLGLAALLFPWLFGRIAIADMPLDGGVWGLAFVVTLALGLLISARPVWVAHRLQPAAVLAKVL
ncbi:MAG: ABC transporter permease [Pseudomonadota bacterium]